MAVDTGARAASAARPEREVVRLGFMPLADCASVVMASVLGLDRKYGIRIVLSRENSWSRVRDKLANGELDAAHVLYGLVYGMQLGVGTREKAMAVLMNLNRNGQSITLARTLADRGAVDGQTLAALIHGEPGRYCFAHTFPTGNHAMLLYYWLAAYGIDPFRDAGAVTIPPAQMVDNLHAGRMDGFCAGEPWGHRAVADGVGITAATSAQVWRDHPGKVLGASAAFVKHHPATCRALVAAVLDAGKWIEASSANLQRAVDVLARPAWLDAPAGMIGPRMAGHYRDGLGNSWHEAGHLEFYGGGAVNFPYLSDAMWFMTQQRRWGLLQHDPDYLAVAAQVNQLALYREAAEMTGTPVPAAAAGLRSSILVDGVRWDGTDPAAYAAGFDIRFDARRGDTHSFHIQKQR